MSINRPIIPKFMGEKMNRIKEIVGVKSLLLVEIYDLTSKRNSILL